MLPTRHIPPPSRLGHRHRPRSSTYRATMSAGRSGRVSSRRTVAAMAAAASRGDADTSAALKNSACRRCSGATAATISSELRRTRIAERHAQRNRQWHRGTDGLEHGRRNRGERSERGFLGVDDVGATSEGRQRLICISNTHEQSHAPILAAPAPRQRKAVVCFPAPAETRFKRPRDDNQSGSPRFATRRCSSPVPRAASGARSPSRQHVQVL